MKLGPFQWANRFFVAEKEEGGWGYACGSPDTEAKPIIVRQSAPPIQPWRRLQHSRTPFVLRIRIDSALMQASQICVGLYPNWNVRPIEAILGVVLRRYIPLERLGVLKSHYKRTLGSSSGTHSLQSIPMVDWLCKFNGPNSYRY